MAIGDRDVYKDDAVRAIDEFFSGNATPLKQAYEYALGILTDESQTLAELARQEFERPEAPNLSDEQVQHFGSHWPPEVQDEMRRGYTEAVRLADGEPPLPIETFWVTGPNNGYEIYARRGLRQVTVLAFIPPDVEEQARRDWPA